jgi:multidrug resistance efflux pump
MEDQRTSENRERGGPGELMQAEALLRQAESALHAAQATERVAEHEIDEARRELEKLERDEILLDIATPRGAFRGVFRDSARVATVIEVVVDKKGLDRKDTYELWHDGTQLQATDRTLESFGLRRKAYLELVATGSGV